LVPALLVPALLVPSLLIAVAALVAVPLLATVAIAASAAAVVVSDPAGRSLLALRRRAVAIEGVGVRRDRAALRRVGVAIGRGTGLAVIGTLRDGDRGGSGRSGGGGSLSGAVATFGHDRVDQAGLAQALCALDAHLLGDALQLGDELLLEGVPVGRGVHEAMPLPSGRS
jgi:hypothetical protein